MPDVDDLRMKVKYNDSIAGILLLNPDNPTGAVYPPSMLKEVVQIAREHKLFLICDEIYAHIVYNGRHPLHLSEVVDDVCALSLRGISKEYPWPGARCGWVEVLNRNRDAMFDTYVDSLLASKRLEVCSTTAPQLTIPPVMGNERYPEHLRQRAATFESRANQATAALQGIDGVRVNRPSGAFYMTAMFEDGALHDHQELTIDKPPVKEMVEGLVDGTPNDQRFVYYLMAATGICVVPLSGFYCKRDGFRITLLECDDRKRAWMLEALANALRGYLNS